MSSWASTRLREIVGSPISGHRPAGGVSTDTEGIPSLGGENILAEGGVTFENLNRVPLQYYRSMSKGQLRPLDVLINKDGAQTGKVGLYQGDFPDACVNEHLFILRSADGTVDQRFLYYEVLSPETQAKIARRITGSAQPGLNSTFVDAVDIPVPTSQDEQRRIAQILGTVDEGIEQTAALIAKSQQIRAGLMDDLFNRGVTSDGLLRPSRPEAPDLYRHSSIGWIPKEWTVQALGECTPRDASICYGIVQPGDYRDDGIPVVAIYNLNSDFTETHRASVDIESAYVRSRIREGDVLLSIKGSIGRVDVTPAGFIGNISRDVARVRPRHGVYSHYLRYVLESRKMQRLLDRISVGTTRLELSIGRLKDVHVPLATEPEQRAIADRLASLDAHLQSEIARWRKLKDLRCGLMSDLLTGRVCVPLDMIMETPKHV